jgi:hypothetical protein
MRNEMPITTLSHDLAADRLTDSVRVLTMVQEDLSKRCEGPTTERAALLIGFEITQLLEIVPMLRQASRERAEFTAAHTGSIPAAGD